MNLEPFVVAARRLGASDIHLEASLPPVYRVRGELRPSGEPIAAESLRDIARTVIGDAGWPEFKRRRSADLARTIRGTRCRIHALHTMHGVALAVRLLGATQPTLQRLNLHPSLAELVAHPHGLILVCGPTGCGKSSTLAALIHEIDRGEPKHVVTLEQPVEFQLRARRSLIRQREVGIDTPSFRRGLLDALREDPDVLMVGEMRDPRTMRLTIHAAETGHLVLATVHSASCAEALHRIVAAFPAPIQPMVCAQLGDCLRAVICQKLVYRDQSNAASAGIRVPHCEILVGSTPARSLVRQGQFFKLQTVLETGAKDGQISWQRYEQWLDSTPSFHVPEVEPGEEGPEEPAEAGARPERPSASTKTASIRPMPRREPVERPGAAAPARDDDDVIVIQPPTESLSDLLDEL